MTISDEIVYHTKYQKWSDKWDCLEKETPIQREKGMSVSQRSSQDFCNADL